MKRAIKWSAWGLVPVVAVALHLGPGQKLWAEDQAARLLRLAQRADDQATRLSAQDSSEEAGKKWAEASELYTQVRGKLDESDRLRIWQVRLAEARVKVNSGEIVEGGEQLRTLLFEVTSAEKPDAALADEIRGEAASTAHATSWLMRLEGASREEWMEESEVARQHYRLLAEAALGKGMDAGVHKENLEAVIRFQNIEDEELKAMPPPKECKNCKGGVCKNKRTQKMSKQKKAEPKDDRGKMQGQGEWRPKGS